MSPTVTGTILDEIIAGVLEDLHERQLMVTSDNLREAIDLVTPAIDPVPRLTAPGLSVISGQEVQSVEGTPRADWRSCCAGR